MGNTEHSTLAADIRRAKIPYPQIQTTGEKKPVSTVRKRIAMETLFNEHPGGAKFFTAAADFRIAHLPSGTNL